jgi:hypothetical protein
MGGASVGILMTATRLWAAGTPFAAAPPVSTHDAGPAGAGTNARAYRVCTFAALGPLGPVSAS